MAYRSSPYTRPHGPLSYSSSTRQQPPTHYGPPGQPMVVIPQRPNHDHYQSKPSFAPHLVPRSVESPSHQQAHQRRIYQEPQSDYAQANKRQRTDASYEEPYQRIHPEPFPSDCIRLSTARPKSQPQPTLTPTSATVEIGRPIENPTFPVNYHHLLLSLAEEYINAAHRMGLQAALSLTGHEENQYCRLMATALGCIESVLKDSKKYNLSPREEATLRLQFANLLVNETENDLDAETMLSKAIIFCDRHHLVDLKYSMHHLLARLIGKSNKRAALKYVDNVISETEAHQHTLWVYAFRFLRVSMLLQAYSQTDISSALQTLRSIVAVAQAQGDTAILVTAATLEAIGHLRSSAADALEQAQRAIATARSFQLAVSLQTLPQINIFIDMIDLACSLQNYNPEQAAPKMQRMQMLLDQSISHGNWNVDGSFSIPIEQSSDARLTQFTAGIFQKGDDARDRLSFIWIRQRDLYALGYYLSGVAKSYINANDGHKAEQYLKEGIKTTGGRFRTAHVAAPADVGVDRGYPAHKFSESLPTASARLAWSRELNCHLRLQLTFALCSRTEWAAAKASLQQLADAMRAPGVDIIDFFMNLATYLSGVIHQGTGDLTSALAVYQSASFALPAMPSRATDPQTDLSILAALNSLLILRDPSHPQHARAEPLLSNLERLCASHPNQNITAAFHLIKAVAVTSISSMIKTKQFLQLSLKSAKTISNHQLMCIVLNFMSAQFFTNIVGEQAEKAGKAGRTMAKKAGDKLWECVADGMVSVTLERHGKGEEARVVKEEGRALARELPGPLREKCFVEEG